MKNFKISIIAVLLFFAGTGCEDELNVAPVNEYLSDNFYLTEDQVYAALIAAYDPVGWSMAFGQWISPVMFGEIRSDNANAGGDPTDNDQPGWQEFDDLTESNSNVILQPIYRKNYIGIFRANLVLTQPKITTDAVLRYQAEAKFLRAYYHFELFRHFGPLPVVTTLLEPDDVDLSRNTMTEVFTSITQDLEEAIEVLPLVSLMGAEEIGRASKGSAQALLGKVYLYWADLDNDDPSKFDLAAEYLGQVAESGQYQLEDDYAALFAHGVKNPVESVFEIQHSNLWPSGWDWFEGIEGNGIIQLTGIRGLCDSHPYYTPGWGFLLPTQDLNDHFLDDDEYRRNTAIVDVTELQQTISNEGVTTCALAVDMAQVNVQDFEGFWQQKYANYDAYAGNNVNNGDPILTRDANVYVIRYADVLLMLAEALHRGNGSDPEAIGYINTVRERAAGPGDNTGTYRTAEDLMSEEGMSLLDVIWYERRAELAGEGDRWYDLVRSGRATADVFAGDPLRSGNFNENSLWLPVALEETSVATEITTYPDAALFE